MSYETRVMEEFTFRCDLNDCSNTLTLSKPMAHLSRLAQAKETARSAGWSIGDKDNDHVCSTCVRQSVKQAMIARMTAMGSQAMPELVYEIVNQCVGFDDNDVARQRIQEILYDPEFSSEDVDGIPYYSYLDF